MPTEHLAPKNTIEDKQVNNFYPKEAVSNAIYTLANMSPEYAGFRTVYSYLKGFKVIDDLQKLKDSVTDFLQKETAYIYNNESQDISPIGKQVITKHLDIFIDRLTRTRQEGKEDLIHKG